MSDLAFIAQRTTGWAKSDWARSETGNPENERMSVSDPWEKIEWGADSEPRINERVPSSEDRQLTHTDKVQTDSVIRF